MGKAKAWIGAMRLRTLPLAISGILMGSFLAASQGKFNLPVTLFAILTAILLQILSNLANDYGDFSKGTDNENRVGPTRALQSGEIEQSEMKKALYLTSILTFLSGVDLLWIGLGTELMLISSLFLLLGLLSIWAAIKYTVGKSAYGYKGLGDVFVFIFFGLVSVMGTYFLQTKSFDWMIILPASVIGFLSAGVLNLNNSRDIVNDKASNKITLAVHLGFEGAKNYQVALYVLSLIFSTFYLWPFTIGYELLYLLGFIPLTLVVVKTLKTSHPEELDPLLKIQALGTLLFSITFGLSLIL